MSLLVFIKHMSSGEIAYNLGIIIFAVVVYSKLSSIRKALIAIREESEKAYKSTSSEIRLDSKGDLSRQSETRISRDKFEPTRRKYTGQLSKYIKWSNMISLLPMAGLLGTVISLIAGLAGAGAEEGFVRLYSSLSMALTSTLVGLVCSIFLKMFTYSGPDRLINEIEIHFEEIDRLFNNAIDLNNLMKD